MKNKSKIVQINLDIIVGCECNGVELAYDVRNELHRRGFTILGADFQKDMTEFYEEYYPGLLFRLTT